MTIAAVLAGKGHQVMTIEVGATLQEAATELARHRIGALLVVDGDRIAGIISERDLIQCMAHRGQELLTASVSEAMTSDVITAEPSMPVLAALALMTKRRIRHLPVTSGNALQGIVSIGDLVKYRMQRIEAEADAMRSYIQSA